MRIQHRYLTFDKTPGLTRLLDQLSVRYKVEEKSYDESTHLYVLELPLRSLSSKACAMAGLCGRPGINALLRGTRRSHIEMTIAEDRLEVGKTIIILSNTSMVSPDDLAAKIAEKLF